MLICMTAETDMDLKLKNVSSVQGYGGENNMKETCEEPFFGKVLFLWKQISKTVSIKRDLGIFLLQFLE